jgi:hypothetical protein
MGFLGDIGKNFGSVTKTIGSFIPGIGEADAQKDANETNINLASQNRQWSEHMSNTAYQRAMDDMKKSGLNPILAYQQGGASVPSVASATVNPEIRTGLANKALDAFTGISLAQTQKQQANTAQANSESSISLQAAQTANALASTTKTQAETAKTIDSIKSQKVQRELQSQQIPLEKTKSAAAELANKGSQRVGTMFDAMLKSTAKPNVDSKTFEYKNPYNPLNWGNAKPKKPASKSGSY